MAKPKVGWFSTDGRPGDRTLDNQLKGLAGLMEDCKGKSVLDVGCAEGLISLEMAKAGAIAVHGVEIVPDHVKVALRLRGDLPVIFECADMNEWRPRRQYDIVIALALLHKLRNPVSCLLALCDAAREQIVLRVPPGRAWVLVDERSKSIPYDLGAVLESKGFTQTNADTGHFGELVGYWDRL